MMDDAELVRQARTCIYGTKQTDALLVKMADRIEAMAAQIELWRTSRRETFDAMCAMRDSINEHIPMPSLESDLLQGPEDSVFCATVAEAVINHVSAHAALIAERDAARDAALEEAAVSHVVKVANDDAKGVSFPPEADSDFDTVNKADIAKLRAEMEAKFGIGQGCLAVIDDPKISSECPTHVNITALPAAHTFTAADLERAWQPIETAPRDGTAILSAGGGLEQVDICAYNARIGGWSCGSCTLDDTDQEPEGYNRPTHWMPLPEPPADLAQCVKE